MKLSEGNPYRFDQPLRSAEAFFGRKGILDACWEVIKQQNSCLSIVGGPGSGKTSLLFRLLDPEEQRQRLDHGDPGPLVYLDCRTISDPEAFFRCASQPIIAQLPPLEAEEYEAPITDDDEFLEFLEYRAKPPVFLLDDFYFLARNPAFPTAFFSYLRGLAISLDVPMIVASCEPLDSCVPPNKAASEFPGIFRVQSLGPFTAEEMAEMLAEQDRRCGISLSPYREHVEALSGRVPSFVQLTCACYFETLRNRSGSLSAKDHQEVRRQVAERTEREHRRIWATLSPDEKALLRDLAQGKQTNLKSNAAESLRAKGYLSENRIFSTVFAEFARNAP